jgi:AcrR family transcriptional regulator
VARRKSGQYEVGRARRDAIITAAQKRFDEDGFHSTAMTSIAAEVGISASGLLHHFPTKKHLLVAVAERRIEDSAARWASLPRAVGGLATLDETIAASRRLLEHPGLIALFVLVLGEAADPSSPAHDSLALRYERAVDGLSGKLQHGIESGEIRADVDVRAIARECIAVTDGLQVQWVISGGTTDIVRGVADHVAKVKAAIRA